MFLIFRRRSIDSRGRRRGTLSIFQNRLSRLKCLENTLIVCIFEFRLIKLLDFTISSKFQTFLVQKKNVCVFNIDFLLPMPIGKRCWDAARRVQKCRYMRSLTRYKSLNKLFFVRVISHLYLTRFLSHNIYSRACVGYDNLRPVKWAHNIIISYTVKP